MCDHPEFEVRSRVGRLTEVEGGPVTEYTLEVYVKCKNCGKPFEFVHPVCGYSVKEATTSVDCRELRVPIRPSKVSVN